MHKWLVNLTDISESGWHMLVWRGRVLQGRGSASGEAKGIVDEGSASVDGQGIVGEGQC